MIKKRSALRSTGRELDLVVRPVRARAAGALLELRRGADNALIARGELHGKRACLRVPVRHGAIVRRALPGLRARLGIARIALRAVPVPDAVRSSVRTPSFALPADYGSERELPRQREPRELISVGSDVAGREAWLEPRAARAWQRMRHAARADGVELQLVSAYRSIAYQRRLLARKLAQGRTLDDLLRVNAAPGFSEHHSGRAIDITTPGSPPVEPDFEQTVAFAWLREHAGRYGFVLSFPEGNPHGIAYEPWHWCYSAR